MDSHTGVLFSFVVHPNMWYSKQQNTVETSTFGSDFVAAKTSREMIQALGYKLCMMGIPIDGLVNMFLTMMLLSGMLLCQSLLWKRSMLPCIIIVYMKLGYTGYDLYYWGRWSYKSSWLIDKEFTWSTKKWELYVDRYYTWSRSFTFHGIA